MSRGMRGRSAIAATLACVAASTALGMFLAPAAHAAESEQCDTRSYSSYVKIDKSLRPDGKAPYGAVYEWCWQGGNVTKFIVNSTWGEDGGVKVDIRPERPLQWGPTYPIFINGARAGMLDHHRIVLQPGIAGQE